MMSFSNDIKLRAQAALKPYLEGDYPANVKNPILLLNYLNQHAIIPRPNYNTVSTSDHSEHAISCKIGDLQMIGSGNTNKIARTRAAQLFLDFLLNADTVEPNSINGDTSQSYSDSVPIDIEEVRGDGVCEVRENLELNFYSMENCVSRVSEQFLIHDAESTGQPILADSQCDQDNIVDPPCDLQNRVVDPQCDLLNSLSSETSSSSTSEIQPSPTAHEQLSCDNYFDPFFKQRPQGCNHNCIMETENITDKVSQDESKPANVSAEKTNGKVETKNIFAVLQKKTQKHLKLIPRFRIENNDSGFRCTVQLGSYYALGEGRNKKDAKTNAAINLLNQISDLN